MNDAAENANKAEDAYKRVTRNAFLKTLQDFENMHALKAVYRLTDEEHAGYMASALASFCANMITHMCVPTVRNYMIDFVKQGVNFYSQNADAMRPEAAKKPSIILPN